VKLNAGSNIRYSFHPKKNIRELYFQGEGFFEIAKSEHPFVVNTASGLQVKVLGTTFNLCAYEEDSTVRTSLLEGHVELSHASGKMGLKAGEMAVYHPKTRELKKENAILAYTYGWINNKLYMDEMSLSEVCKRLERQYDVQIALQGDIGETIHYNGVLQEESITDVLNALVQLSRIKYRMSGKKINITSK
jgi:ferric-dicitrate binding protein FerR (iron transport regulator)